MQCVEVISPVSFGNVAIGIRKVPLAASGTGIISWGRRGIHAESRHESGAHVIVMEISADAELCDLKFICPESLGRSTDRIVGRTVEIGDVAYISTNFRRKKPAVESRLLGARIPVEPAEVCKSERLRLLARFCRVCRYGGRGRLHRIHG